MKTIEEEVVEWDLTKKQRELFEAGDFRGCLKISQRRYYFNALWILLHCALFGFLAFSKLNVHVHWPPLLESSEAVVLAFLVLLGATTFGYRLAKSQLKERYLEAKIKADRLTDVETSQSKA